MSSRALAMCATGERVAWASVQGQLKKLAARIEALERAAARIRNHSLPRLTRPFATFTRLLGKILVPEVVSNVCFGG